MCQNVSKRDKNVIKCVKMLRNASKSVEMTTFLMQKSLKWPFLARLGHLSAPKCHFPTQKGRQQPQNRAFFAFF
jgi:hypothetical protein